MNDTIGSFIEDRDLKYLSLMKTGFFVGEVFDKYK